MEDIKILANEEGFNHMTEVLSYSESKQRRLWFGRGLYPVNYISKRETDTHIYWGEVHRVPMFQNNKLFYKYNNTGGISFDKEKKTLKIWFGKRLGNLSSAIRKDIYKHFNIDWLSAVNETSSHIINQSLLQRIIRGKITNPRDLAKAYLKNSSFRARKDISPELFYKALMAPKEERETGGQIHYYTLPLLYSTSPNELLKLIIERPRAINGDAYDTYEQAAKLNRLVNPLWSETKFKEVHKQWTRELMELEIKDMEAIDYSYPEDLFLIEGLSIIPNNYMLFQEGTIMDHCLYTSYQTRIRDKDYFALHYEYEGQKATIGIILDDNYRYNKPCAIIQQIKGVRNSVVPEEHTARIYEWIKLLEVEDWFIRMKQAHAVQKIEKMGLTPQTANLPDWL